MPLNMDDTVAWPYIKNYARLLALTCLNCQRPKVHRNTVTPLSTFAAPDIQFDQVHIYIVGPTPPHIIVSMY